jgi:hypothetical protein
MRHETFLRKKKWVELFFCPAFFRECNQGKQYNRANNSSRWSERRIKVSQNTSATTLDHAYTF